MNELGVRLYLEDDAAGNVLLSPPAAALPIAFAARGAKGQTRAELLGVHGFQEVDDGAWVRWLRGLVDRDEPGCEVGGSNHVFHKQILELLEPYRTFLEEEGQASVEALVPGGRELTDQVNQRIKEATRGRIDDLIPFTAANHLIVLILASAIHFDGEWGETFSKEETAPDAFHLASGPSVQVPFMRSTRAASFAAIEGLRVLELPFACGDLSMVFLLPGQEDQRARIRALGLGKPAEGTVEAAPGRFSDLASLEAELTLDNLERWLAALRSRKVSISLPRFSVSEHRNLRPAFEAMGVNEAFLEGVADFSEITEKSIWIQWIYHSATLDVDEEGGRGAAGGAVVFRGRGMTGPARFHADQPFIFLIRDRESGGILFLGKVTDPRAQP